MAQKGAIQYQPREVRLGQLAIHLFIWICKNTVNEHLSSSLPTLDYCLKVQ